MCNVGLEKWEKNDIPWYQHLQWSKSCPYVEACKHNPHVAKIIEKGMKKVSFLRACRLKSNIAAPVLGCTMGWVPKLLGDF